MRCRTYGWLTPNFGGNRFNALGFLPRQLGERFGFVQRVHWLADKVLRQRQGISGVVVHGTQNARNLRRSGRILEHVAQRRQTAIARDDLEAARCLLIGPDHQRRQ
jgi:hypothetical protein